MVRYGNWLVLIITIFLIGCDFGDSVSDGGTTTTIVQPTTNFACDPFNSQNPALFGHGLVTTIQYLTDSQPRYTDVTQYISNGQAVPVTLYMNDINVPTRLFDRGFYTQAGSLIVDQNGKNLYEYFSLDMLTSVTLGPNDSEGDYQFAILSDDGTLVEINNSGEGFQTLIDNNGTHPTKMGCETSPVHMSNGVSFPMHIMYYQGPRYEIALTLLWRPYPTNPNAVTDPLCGQMGNYLFFDPDVVPSTPEQAFLDLQSRGWQVLTAQNYLLPPNSNGTNPCASAQAPVISNVRIDNVTQTAATVSWTTDIPSTSQVAYVLSPSNNYLFTPADGTLVTSHSVTLTGLQDFGFYSVYAISSSGGSQTASNTLTFRTLR